MAGFLVLTVRVAVGAVLLVAVARKVSGRSAYREFTTWLAGLPVVPARAAGMTAAAVVAAESATVVLLAVPATRAVGLALASALLLGFAAAVELAVRRGAVSPCRCLGSSGTRPMGRVEVVRDLVLGAAAGAAALAVVVPAARMDVVLAIVLGLAVALAVVRTDRVVALLTAPTGRRSTPTAGPAAAPAGLPSVSGGPVAAPGGRVAAPIGPLFAPDAPHPLPGTKVAEFAVVSTTGEPVSRDRLSGTTLVGFFAQGCPTCADVAPRFAERAAVHPGGRDQVLAVIVGDRSRTGGYVDHLAGSARVVTEPFDGPVCTAFGVDGFPGFTLLAGTVVVASTVKLEALRPV